MSENVDNLKKKVYRNIWIIINSNYIFILNYKIDDNKPLKRNKNLFIRLKFKIIIKFMLESFIS